MSKLIRFGVSAALLGYLAFKTDWGQLGAAFASLRLEMWLAAAGLLVVAQVVSAVRWRALARPLGFRQSLGKMTGFYFIGMFFNLLLPTSVGGDVVRAWYLSGRSGSRLLASLSVFLDRLSGLWVLLALACLGVIFSPLALPPLVVGGVWFCAGAGLAGSLLLPLLAHHHRRFSGRLHRLGQALHSLPAARLLFWPTALSVVVQVANVIIVLLLGQGLAAPVPASYYWILVPMVSLLTMLPVSVNGMGVREWVMAKLLEPWASQETAITLALLWFAVSATVSLGGGLVYLFGRFERPSLSRTRDEVETDHGPIGCNPHQGREGQSQAAA